MSIEIQQIHRQEFQNLQSSKLVLNISYPISINVICNTLRRISYDYVPMYVFHKDTITIDKNTSIFDNDEMKLRLSQITVPKIINKIVYLDSKYWLDVNYSDPNRAKHLNDTKVLEMFINKINTTDEVLNVTTNHATIIEDGIQIRRFNDKYPHLLLQLRPGQEFNAQLRAVLGVGKISAIWSSVRRCFFDEINDTTCKFTIESMGQYDEYEILYKCCVIFVEKISVIKNSIIHDFTDTTLTEVITYFPEEDHTICFIINEFLQNNDNVEFAGFTKPNLVIDNVSIKLKTNGRPCIDVYLEVIEQLINLFDEIKKQVLRLGKQYMLI